MNKAPTSDALNPGYQVKSFIVRLWQRPEGFTAEARPVTGGQNRTFTSLEELFNFLREQAEMEPMPDDDGGDDPGKPSSHSRE